MTAAAGPLTQVGAAGGLLVLPHPEVLDTYRGKRVDYDRWLSGMRRYRLTLD